MKIYWKSKITRRLSRRLFLEEALLTATAVSTGSSRVLVATDRAKQNKIRAAFRVLSSALIGTKNVARSTQNENEI
ncbi:MAG TPA: hypothetical protein VMW72_01450 [Sedimentisphaerales bacterium]|nr:hypothetical protein [Sedimentisphaerales bacterium]